MPTAYTEQVGSGEIDTLEKFALRCARSFGALISMRDDPLDAPIPESFEATDHYARRAEEAMSRLFRLEQMTDSEIEAERDKEYQTALCSYKETTLKNDLSLQRWRSMLDAAILWEPPTTEHTELKTFMISQLTESISYGKLASEGTKPPAKLVRDTWRANKISQALTDIEYYNRMYADDKVRASSKSEWVKKLRESL